MIICGNKVMNLLNIYLFNDEYYFIYFKDCKEDVIKLFFIEF